MKTTLDEAYYPYRMVLAEHRQRNGLTWTMESHLRYQGGKAHFSRSATLTPSGHASRRAWGGALKVFHRWLTELENTPEADVPWTVLPARLRKGA